MKKKKQFIKRKRSKGKHRERFDPQANLIYAFKMLLISNLSCI